MLPNYHRQILLDALSSRMGRKALTSVIRANLSQDLPAGQIGHPEFHFDDCQIKPSNAYIASLRENTVRAIEEENNPPAAWTSFGQLTHTAQDYYAHTTYIRIWVEGLVDKQDMPEEQDILIPEILLHKDLISGRFYAPWEWITFLPWLGQKIGKLFPKDSHASLNNDSPSASPYFKQVYRAAVLRTVFEYNQIIQLLSTPAMITRFTGLESTN